MSDAPSLKTRLTTMPCVNLRHLAANAGQLGIDALTSKLQRASALLDFCQQRLTKTEAEVQAVLKRLGLEDAE